MTFEEGAESGQAQVATAAKALSRGGAAGGRGQRSSRDAPSRAGSGQKGDRKGRDPRQARPCHKDLGFYPQRDGSLLINPVSSMFIGLFPGARPGAERCCAYN